MSSLVRDGVRLAYEEIGAGDPSIVLVHGIACHRGFWPAQLHRFAGAHRILAVDLRGHGQSDAPRQDYDLRGFADDIGWMCEQLDIRRAVVVGHSLGGLVALALAGDPRTAAVAMLDSVLLAPGERAPRIRELVAGLRSDRSERVLRDYFAAFFGPHDDPRRRAWILDQTARTPPWVTSSVWERSLISWDDTAALARCAVPLLYIDSGTPNCDLAGAARLAPQLVVGRTVGSGHFAPLEIPDQITAMLDRFIEIALPER